MKTSLFALLLIATPVFAQAGKVWIDPEAAKENIKSEEGFEVGEIREEGPFYKAGIRVGDIITKMGSKTITSANEFAEASQVLVNSTTSMKITVTRNHEELTFTVSGYAAPKSKAAK